MKNYLPLVLLLISTSLFSSKAFAQEIPGGGADPDSSLIQNGPELEPLNTEEVSTLTNYPNPVNTSTTMHYKVPAKARVSLKIYNSAAQLVSVVVNGYQKAGAYNVKYNASHMSRGAYVCRLSIATDKGISAQTRMLYVVR